MNTCTHPQTIPHNAKPEKVIIKGSLCLRCRLFSPDMPNCAKACCTPEAKTRR